MTTALSIDQEAAELLGEALGTSPKLARRGTTNRNARGGSEERRRRKVWLIETYRADRDVVMVKGLHYGPMAVEVEPGTEGSQPACRCYRCGVLLVLETVTVDRIKPGIEGGTYRRSNIRPACAKCNEDTGRALGNRRTAAKRARGKR